jgi:hypothetical protein
MEKAPSGAFFLRPWRMQLRMIRNNSVGSGKKESMIPMG